MRIIAKRTLRIFWEKHPQSEIPLSAWYGTASRADWKGPAEIKAAFGSNVDFVGDSRLIFDIGGNKFRLVVHVAYVHSVILVKFVGTHKEYNKVNPEKV